MITRQAKLSFYAVAGPFMRINGYLYRQFRAPKKGTVRVHLGPGQKNYFDGWINVDANIFTGRCDLWADLRNPLPFRDESVDCFYSHHVIEHLPDIQTHIEDVFRCLKPGGVYRVGGPNGDSAILKYQQNDLQWFHDYPDKRASIGGRFENFIFCRGEHLTMLTFSYLEELFLTNGFARVALCRPIIETGHPDLFAQCLTNEYEDDFAVPHTLIVEASKP